MLKIATQLANICGAKELKKLTVLYILAAAFEGITLVLLLPFMQSFFVGNLFTFSTTSNNSHLFFTNPWLWAVLISGIITLGLSTYANIFSYRNSVYTVCDTLIEKIEDQALHLPLGWFTAKREALLVSAVSKEVNTASHLSTIVLPTLVDATVLPIILTLGLLYVNPLAALIIFVTTVILVAIMRIFWQQTALANTHESQAAQVCAGRLVEFARLQPVLRANGLATSWPLLENALAAENNATKSALSAGNRPLFGFQFILQVAFAGILLLTYWQLIGGYLDLLTFLAIAAIVARMLPPISKAILYLKEATNFAVALEVINEVLTAQRLTEPDMQTAKYSADLKNHEITFENVSFGYEPGKTILENVSFTAAENQMTALVGPSGCGKSTLLRLAARFWDADKGSIKIGGVDVRNLPNPELMSQFSMVFQEVYLFDTTIKDNIKIARPTASDKEIHEAICRARLDKVIADLPEGWDTPVGKGGLRLSGGERQRVAIARAFLKNSPILLLDELTSALDSENEAEITQVLDELTKDCTVIVVAHRLSTISKAKQVIVLDPTTKNIAQLGTPHELAQQKGIYAEFLAAANSDKHWKLNS